MTKQQGQRISSQTQRRGEGGMSAARKEMRDGTDYKALSAVRVFMCVCRAGGKQSIQVQPPSPLPRKGSKLTGRGGDSGKKGHSQSEGNFRNAPRNEEGWTVLPRTPKTDAFA